MIASAVGGSPTTTYAENIGVMAATGASTPPRRTSWRRSWRCCSV
ncbi:MAG: solute carrier family 23 protein [Aquabacterium sp.]